MDEPPRLLDLFCGAGGAAMGYSRAGFEVVGVDVVHQPHYPFNFYREDALLFASLLTVENGPPFDAIHASPPCQAYTILGQSHRNAGKVYPDLLGATRKMLEATGLPWVIENVPGSPMRPDYILCGSMFGMKVQRHRWFECSWQPAVLQMPCAHLERPVVVSGNNHSGGHTAAEIKAAMQMPWARTRYEVRQAIPPAFTEFIGTQLVSRLRIRKEAER